MFAQTQKLTLPPPCSVQSFWQVHPFGPLYWCVLQLSQTVSLIIPSISVFLYFFRTYCPENLSRLQVLPRAKVTNQGLIALWVMASMGRAGFSV